MNRKIVGFHQDEEQHWVAELECGHNQHVRHDPPWTNRPWTVTPQGRAAMLGQVLPCRKCDTGPAEEEGGGPVAAMGVRSPKPPERHVRSAGDKFALDVGPSAIDGRGVFAGEPIPARRKIGEIRGEPLTVKEARRRVKTQRRIMMVEVSEKTAIDASASTHALRFTNHSCRPNAMLRIVQGRVELYALRDLTTGEEITVDYGETHHEGRLRCRCGAPGCVGHL